MTARRLWGLLFLALWLTHPAPTAAKEPQESTKPQIRELETRIEAERVLVSFVVANGLSEQELERIHSGIPVSIRHRLVVVSPRWLPLMPAKTVARTLVDVRVEYDSLTRRYSLTRTVEHRGRDGKNSPPPEDRRRVTDDLEEMRSWMTRLEEVPVFDPARSLPVSNLTARVESSLGRKYVLWIFPTTLSASAQRKLEP